MASRLSVTASVNRPNISASSYEEEPLYALLNLQPEVDSNRQRSPLNLCLVIDASGTMYNFQLSTDEREYWMGVALARDEMERGEADDRDAVYWSGQTLQEMQSIVRRPMTMAVEALKQLLQSLQHADQAAVVAFADLTQTLFNEEDWLSNPEHCLGQLDNLLEQRLPVDIGTGTKMAQSLQTAHSLVQKHASQGSINRIIVLSDGIVQDKRETLEAIESIERDGVAITTIGVGDEFDEEFLMRVADSSRGAYYYAADIHEITQRLMEELSSIQSTAFQDVHIAAQGLSGAVVQDVYMVRPSMTIFEEMEIDGGWLRARVGDLPGDVATALLVQIAPAIQPAGDHQVVDARLSWKSAEDGTAQTQTASVDVTFSDDPTLLAQRNAEVQDLVDRFSIYKYEREAQRAQEKGDIEQAKEKLGAATRQLLKLGEDSLAHDLEQQIADLGNVTQDPSRVKRIKATTRKLGEKVSQ
jgi:Ca-activated chloride channel family protein